MLPTNIFGNHQQASVIVLSDIFGKKPNVTLLFAKAVLMYV